MFLNNKHIFRSSLQNSILGHIFQIQNNINNKNRSHLEGLKMTVTIPLFMKVSVGARQFDLYLAITKQNDCPSCHNSLSYNNRVRLFITPPFRYTKKKPKKIIRY